MTKRCDECRYWMIEDGTEPCWDCYHPELPKWKPADPEESAPPAEAATTRTSILREAERIVTQDRNSQYGEPEDCFGLIAAYWSAHLDTAISAADVAVMLTMLKLARIKANPGKRDSWVDGCGYLACGAEIAEARA